MPAPPNWLDFEEKLRRLHMLLDGLATITMPVTRDDEFIDIRRDRLAALIDIPARQAESLYADFLALRTG
ncbi:MAG: hypothetical protein ABS35_19655 [Kaistia sp. SCN 65-12]|uniref:hypothetical protein n=1 Tax=Bosea sp. (in: a-proteobacteria) TaxID=1871050 RepID=UPI00086F8F54|nr:hypothetical protein [Bosea sp. (in: a-proteobacteria)]MBN9471687.1 hypothetical protein [Bosea sp. (in: a-proteobacteria)]ODT20483.1 MAG: hypothetical protein ABS35_19655 [Kaistia sp. SCN 65-12]